MTPKYPHFPKMLRQLLKRKCIHVDDAEILHFYQFASYVADVRAGAKTDTGQYLYID